ncbi:Protein YIPF6 [Strongyloides ratti]|uniref:Protein YIPF n=1 Tax=Strongyloides ratti TaxID=34506 RepID=A0A090KYX1_STRRB|nr:Protein YIPF6 [Strongyloides ratti]CEF60439.1 Protein YIPF6 [Strongyloides ratti]
MTDPFGNVSVDIDLLEKEIRSQSERNVTLDNSSFTNTQTAGGSSFGDSFKLTKAEGMDTLNESVKDSIMRDINSIVSTFKQVLYPKGETHEIMKNWNLWAPLFICVALALLLLGENKGPDFTQLFILTFFGSWVVTWNIKFLGGKISFFQAICIIGYCLVPQCVAALTFKILTAQIMGKKFIFFLRLLITFICFIWSALFHGLLSHMPNAF